MIAFPCLGRDRPQAPDLSDRSTAWLACQAETGRDVLVNISAERNGMENNGTRDISWKNLDDSDRNRLESLGIGKDAWGVLSESAKGNILAKATTVAAASLPSNNGPDGEKAMKALAYMADAARPVAANLAESPAGARGLRLLMETMVTATMGIVSQTDPSLYNADACREYFASTLRQGKLAALASAVRAESAAIVKRREAAFEKRQGNGFARGKPGRPAATNPLADFDIDE